ncbi:hypothetical protein [Sphingomonas sp. TREG-RG-20F-R18-01]|uniref:hypothetical protein n=1 Tax=Sphingomonas sp. TREG-RG-20F-R18-01 TaxID=2914982 RepID=UPI001F5A493B|nr:hypothetical protein [Sphingomonas sp. TREG-RG-20F-R18-01]
MTNAPKWLIAATVLTTAPLLGATQQTPLKPLDSAVLPQAPAIPYADYADLVVAAPVIVDATIRSDVRLKPAEAPDVPQNAARLYVEADVTALIRGTGAVPPRIGYTIDVPLDAHGRPPRYRKTRVLLFARGVANNQGQIQLVRSDAQRNWTPAADALTRQIVREVLAPDTPPTVTGVGNAFFTAGDLPGDGETQIFLTTADSRPISLNVLRKAGQPPRWSVALTEVVDQAAPPPAARTLLWYRLACSLPATLPDTALHGSEGDNAIVREDYATILSGLGACDRTAVAGAR